MYSGSDWIINSLKVENISELGKDVADMLGFVFQGIYHIERDVRRVDWSNKHWIEILVYGRGGDLATFDYSRLTLLVFAAHQMAIRVEITSANPQYLRIMFHRRNRGPENTRRHPTLDEAVALFKDICYLPEK